MMAFINAAPQVAGYTLDLVAEAMSWPKHEEFARRIRMTLPPGMLDPKDMTPDMQLLTPRQQAQAGQAQAVADAVPHGVGDLSQDAIRTAAQQRPAPRLPSPRPLWRRQNAATSADRMVRIARPQIVKRALGLEAVRVADEKLTTGDTYAPW
jgi:hypothetical protein